jgi:hypothetical protein
MLITLYEIPDENISFGQGEAQRGETGRITGQPSPGLRKAAHSARSPFSCEGAIARRLRMKAVLME